MKKIFLPILILLCSCSTPTLKNDLDFSDEMSFNDFKLALDEYSKNNSFPNIDNLNE